MQKITALLLVLLASMFAVACGSDSSDSGSDGSGTSQEATSDTESMTDEGTTGSDDAMMEDGDAMKEDGEAMKEDGDAMKQDGEAMKANWDKFRNDPAWVKAKGDSEADGPIVERLTSQTMKRMVALGSSLKM